MSFVGAGGAAAGTSLAEASAIEPMGMLTSVVVPSSSVWLVTPARALAARQPQFAGSLAVPS